MKPECTHCRERFSDYLDGLLPAPERAEVDAHLAGCAECRRELDLWRATVQAVGELPRRAAPQGFGARVMEGLDAQGAPAPERKQLRSLWLRAVPIAAMLLVVLGVIVIVQRSGPPAPTGASSPSGATIRLAEHIPPPEAGEAPAPMARAAAPAAATAPAVVATPGAAAAYGGSPVAPAEARRAGASSDLAFAMRKPADDEAAKEEATTRQRSVEAVTGVANGSAAAEQALRATLDMKDQAAAQPEAGALALRPSRDATLFFQQMAARPAVTQPPHQVLTMRAKDPTDLIRRAIKAANQQGLEVTLVFKPDGEADISIQVPADRYDALVAALVDLTAPQSQTMSNTAYAQSDFYRQALVNYNALNSNRLEQQKAQLAQAPAATDRLLEAARKAPAPEAGGTAGGGAGGAGIAATAAPVANAPARPAAGPAAGTLAGAAPAAARPQQEEEAAAMASQMRAMPQATAKSAPAASAREEAKKGLAAPAGAGPPQVVNLQITILKGP